MPLENAVIVDAARSPFARGGRGMLVATRLDEVAATVLRRLLDRNPTIPDATIEDVGVGNVQGRGTEFSYLGNIQRIAGLPLEVCSFHSNRQCGSSMETLHRTVMAIMVGSIECGVAMGVERMGRSLMPRGGGSDATRVTGMNPRVFAKNDLQRNMAHDHDKYFSVPIPDPILDAAPLISLEHFLLDPTRDHPAHWSVGRDR